MQQKKTKTIWNKGLTKERGPRVAKYAKKVKRTLRKMVRDGTYKPPKITPEGIEKMRKTKRMLSKRGMLTSSKKGKTLEEFYGSKRAGEIRKKLSESHKGQPGFWTGKKRVYSDPEGRRKKTSKTVKEKMKTPSERKRRSRTLRRKLRSGEIKRDYKRYWKEHPEAYKRWTEALMGRNVWNKGLQMPEKHKKKLRNRKKII